MSFKGIALFLFVLFLWSCSSPSTHVGVESVDFAIDEREVIPVIASEVRQLDEITSKSSQKPIRRRVWALDLQYDHSHLTVLLPLLRRIRTQLHIYTGHGWGLIYSSLLAADKPLNQIEWLIFKQLSASKGQLDFQFWRKELHKRTLEGMTYSLAMPAIRSRCYQSGSYSLALKRYEQEYQSGKFSKVDCLAKFPYDSLIKVMENFDRQILCTSTERGVEISLDARVVKEDEAQVGQLIVERCSESLELLRKK